MFFCFLQVGKDFLFCMYVWREKGDSQDIPQTQGECLNDVQFSFSFLKSDQNWKA